MKLEKFMTVYAASREWRISEGFFEVIKSIDSYSEWFSGKAKGYGQNLVLVEALPTIKKIYDQNVQEFNNYNSNSDYINMGTLMKGVLKTDIELKQMIDSKKYEHLYVKLLRRKRIDSVFGPYIYFFKHDFLEECEYLTTGFISKALGKRGIKVSNATILNYKRNGELMVKVNNYGLDTLSLKEVESLVLDKRKEKYSLSQKYSIENSNFTVLNSEQRKTIEDYLSFRAQGGRISHNNYRAKKYIANKEETIPKLRSALATFFFRIICSRCHIEQQPKMRYASLTHEEKKQYNPDIFNPLDVDVEDAFAFTAKSKTTTAVSVYQTIKPFYSWVLQRRKAEASTPEKWFEFGQLERRIESFLNQFPANYNEVPADEKINQKEKAFLTREQMVLVRMKILNAPLSHNPYKYASIWELCCVSALRPYEVRKLRIEYFLLDSEGFLALNNRGWGVLHLPREASKQERSSSHPIYGTPIPPGTVKRINEYLRRLYKKQRNEPVGVGYMFRPEDLFPESGYKSSIIFDMTRLKEQLDFLTLEQRRDFELKTARRSMNNLIDGFSVKLPIERLNGRIQKVAADVQMRHQIAGDIGEKHYTETISEEDFYTVLDLTINFPWDLNELAKWEKEIYKEDRGLISKPKNNKEEYALSNHQVSPTHLIDNSELSARIMEIKKQLNKLRKRPKELSLEEWFEKREALEKELFSIK
ncbi:hypothetical protein M3182_00710 [Mesobacillus maritimus]|uniref:hypothetical protein n=1 Tax=Mesobacillus maritimus TaxID=1643336 RepID=UPI00204112C7|nr:hypothetical protein [Mesobacillus maritimus]MCM3584260.1 hypothetical protein [Mesobacillus maritimus]